MIYLVKWSIDIEADSAEEAAAKALVIQRDNDPANTACVFEVYDGTSAIPQEIDLHGVLE